MIHKKFFFVSLFLFSSIVAFSHGKNDIEEISVENMNSWQESFDLESKKAGKYNILITAKDLGGNTYIEGPHNIWLDPKSDIPICGITNPYPNMRVIGNLNIIGSCVDDDGVSRVELVLDEGTEIERRVLAEGTEFWSYYLETNDLEEGPHTIKVYGYDINENPVESKPVTVTWQLDRKQPVTLVNNEEMGVLVSGNVKFEGVVSDGNGIKQLEYSTDNGGFFAPVKLNSNKTKDICTFSLNIDTKKFNDGANVLWFRATDVSGSVGIYTFLYFVDNTKPDVKIITPEANEEADGKFTIAGIAKDAVGITSLTWTFGSETGEIPLIPGNPYWAVDVNTIGSKDKSRKFTIKAVDRAKNVVEVSRDIKLNQENDKPVAFVSEPAEGKIIEDTDALFVRGIVTDDDSVHSVKIQLDNKEPYEFETTGAFYYQILNPGELSAGNHKITVTPVDVNLVEGNPVVTNVVSKGIAPTFTNKKILRGKDSLDFNVGMEIHPESGSVLSVTAESQVGLTNVRSELTWGNDGLTETNVDLKNASSYVLNIPVTADFAKGVVKLSVTATDSIGRTSSYKTLFYVTNTSDVKPDEPKIVFDDSRFDSEGGVINNPEFPASGYVIGATPTSVELVPSTPFAHAELDGNQIRLVAQNAVGSSENVVVRVRTAEGGVLESSPIRFKADTALPEISININDSSTSLDARYEDISVSGNVKCATGVGSVKYRLLKIAANIQKGVIASVVPEPVTQDLQSLNVDRSGNFTLSLSAQDYDFGIYVVEIIAESAGGNKTATAFSFSTIPEVEEVNGKIPAAKAPVIVWLDGFDVYAVAVYQGELESNFATFYRLNMNEGNNPVDFSVTDPASGKVIFGKYTAVKNPSLSANFALVDGEEYLSGKTVVLNYGEKSAKTISVYIDTGAAVNSVSYEFSGNETFGGDNVQKGSAKLIKPLPDNPNRWIAEIPVANLPARINKCTVTIKAGTLEQTISGSIKVVRVNDSEKIDDDAKIYALPDSSVSYNEDESSYVLTTGSEFYYYANAFSPLRAEVVSATQGLVAEVDGNLVKLRAEKDGRYRNVSLRITDKIGKTYTSVPVNFIVDSTPPDVNLVTPELASWLGNTLRISGTAADALGIKYVSYSLDGGETWQEFNIGSQKNSQGVTFSQTVDISDLPEGLIKIDIKAEDSGGHIAYYHSAVAKDVTPPAVRVILPQGDDIINGTNLVVFGVTDNGYFEKAEYIAPPIRGREQTRNSIPVSRIISTTVGTENAPIDDAMSFSFADAAGNTTVIESWDFLIDLESDLPVIDISIPNDMQVITRDFEVSGIVIDDDGECAVFYKIDNGPFKQVSTNEVYQFEDSEAEYKMKGNFVIQVPISTMTDNEHTVTCYAVDLNGVKGNEVTRTFRISLEEPKGAVVAPTIEESVRETITISGWASDKNDIEKVQVSLDNGNSYNDAIGTTDWHYVVDTRAIPGGTQVVFLKITDKYGIEGLYSSLINIDNNAPELSLELPLDDSTTTGTVFFSGFVYDNVEVTDLHITIRNLDRGGKPEVYPLNVDRIIGQTFELNTLADGNYNVEVTAEDAAGNITNVSRNIHLDKSRPPATVDILYPLDGEHKNGVFTIYGMSESENEIETLRLMMDGKNIQETSLTDSGFFKFELGPENIAEGAHVYRVDTVLKTGKTVSSREQRITYSPVGPWVTIDNFTYGDFATNRPYIRGQAGYSISEDELLLSKTKEASPEYKAMVAAKKVAKIELSMDNGKTFTELSKNEKWMYRIENQDIAEGYHFFLIRATMLNGEVAVTRTIVQIDNTKPNVRLIAPVAGGRYNQTLAVSGLSNDDVSLEDVTVTLRKGDKASYEVPSFIQGLYIDFRFWGATLFSAGLGLTAFDDVVKLQFSFGQFTQQQRDAVSSLLNLDLTALRYGGNVLSFKILANITSIPFSYFFGHDFDWLYAAIAVGADFSYFMETASGKPQILSSLLAQLEFPKVQLQNVKMFSSFSLYTEASLWFIPTDVTSQVKIKNLVPQFAVGLRTNVF